MKTEHFIVTGMTCGGCVNSLTQALKALKGVRSVSVTLATGETAVEYDENAIETPQLTAAVEDAGYNVELKQAG